jgi:NADH:quinone reductase (non-electrogenic)
MNRTPTPHIVIVGGGFGGLYCAKKLGSKPVRVTLLDRRNFHLFQPLLYQVATGGLSPGEVASPLRAIFSKHKNITVLSGEVTDIFPDENQILFNGERMNYDALIVATGVRHDYFGHSEWASIAPGLKTIEDALEIRSHVFNAFEEAEQEKNEDARRAWMTFVIIGGGPTGVELAGTLGELAHHTLKEDFRSIDPTKTEIILMEASERILPTFDPALSEKAVRSLRDLGVIVRTGTRVTNVQKGCVYVGDEQIHARTILWAAGVKASPLGGILAERAKAELDRAGRVKVNPNLTVGRYNNLFVIGDLAHCMDEKGNQLPGVAPVAMQQGRYVSHLLLDRMKEKERGPFHYYDKGNLAVIGRNAAVAQSGKLKVSGFLAWLGWAFIHIYYLIEFDNKLLVMVQWALNYFTRKRGARLITGENC